MTVPVLVSTRKSLRMVAACSVLCSLLAPGQTAAPKAGSAPLRTAQSSANTAPHKPPCWQQAGISKEAMEQRRAIEQNIRTQVESVCADTSLTPQQKHAKIKELRQQGRQQIESIITPQQQEELKACNTERNAGRSASSGPRPGASGLGPCGETASAPAQGNRGDNPAGNNTEPKQH
jgi:hypothetical protein